MAFIQYAFHMNLLIRPFSRYHILLFTVLVSSSSITQASGVTTGVDKQAKLPYWQYENGAISIRFIQRLPDQTRGYFMARGFSADRSELIAGSCVFQTVFRNISKTTTPVTIDYDMRNWQTIQNGHTGQPVIREEWASKWNKLNITVPAKLAFNWSLLPTTQHYQSGDYNWGMATFNLTPGSRFDLKLSWKQSDEQHHIVLPNMQCAEDLQIDPQG